MLKRMLQGMLGLALVLAALVVWAADFTQPEHDREFTANARRQNTTMAKYFGNVISSEVSFYHEGKFRVLVERAGIERRLTLVPTALVPYSSLDELAASIWGKHLVVGYLDMPYANFDPYVPPGSYVLKFDGQRVHLVNYSDDDMVTFPASLELPGEDAPLAPEQGSLDSVPGGLAYISPGDELTLYLQLSDADDGPLRAPEGFSKVMLRFAINGVSEDETEDVLVGDMPAAAEDEAKAAADA